MRFAFAAALAVLLLRGGGVRAAPLPSSPYRIVDAVDFADAASCARHRAAITDGFTRRERVGVGALVLPVAGACLRPGGRVQAVLASRGLPAWLMVMLATATRDYGKRQAYRVLVDGVEAASADEPDSGGGITRSLFVSVPPGKPRPITVRIEAEARSAAPVTVASVRLVTGPFLQGAPDPRDRVGVALLTSKDLGYDIDRAEMERIRALIPTSKFLVPQAAVLYNFAQRDAAQNAREIDGLADLAASSGVPLRIAFQFHWGGIPAGVPDGAGGHFTDVPYQMITYDPDNHVETPELKALMGASYDRRFGLSVPNRWGDTPWLSFNHPRLNQLYRGRIHQALAAWVSARGHLADGGKAYLLPGELSTGEETIYWAKGVDDSAYTAANGGHPRSDLSADFNPFTVVDALKDGVVLDPRDGLSGKERWWLHQNLAHYQQHIVDWMMEAVPAEAIRETPAGPRFASDLVRRNVFTEPYAMPCFPMKDVSEYHPGLEVGYVRDGRSGGEYWSGATMLPWLLKERERGRIALPNLECTGANDPQLVACLRAAYACGARFVTLYNWAWRSNIDALLGDFARSIAQVQWLAFPPADRPAAAAPAGTAPGPGRGVVDAAATPRGPVRPLERVWTAGPGAFAINCVEVFATGPVHGASLRIRVRAEDGSRSVAVAAPVSAARAGDAMRVYLPTPFPMQPGRRYRVSAAFVAGTQAALAASGDGDLAVRVAADIGYERRRSVVVEDLQDARDIIDGVARSQAAGGRTTYATAALDQARSLLAQGDPVASYAEAVRAEQLTLPAAFDVPSPKGRLAPYFVTVACPAAPVHVTIAAYGSKSITVRVESAVAQSVRVEWAGSRTQASLAAHMPAEIVLVRAAKTAGRRATQPARRTRRR